MNDLYQGFSRPVYLVAKPVGSVCNLDCTYCYYLEKGNLYRGKAARQLMTDEMLERFVKLYIEAQTAPHAVFNWHGGETLMRPVGFYRKAVELQKKYGKGMLIENTIQTNGTLLDDRWCDFFRENDFLVGISIDGPEEFHDAYRRDRLDRPSFSAVMNGISLLRKHGVEWNALAVVNNLNVKQPERFYNFFREIGCRYLQFTPIVERFSPKDDGRELASPDETETEGMTPESVTSGEWGDFLCRVFDLWVRRDVGNIFVQTFDAVLANYAGVTPGICSLAPTCGHAGVIEHNGDVYSCDHFVFPQFRLGNIKEKSVVEMMSSPRQIQFGLQKKEALPDKCRQCRFLFACNGECPKNRFGEGGVNYLCKGYSKFFEYTEPYFRFMLERLERGLPPSDVMGLFRQE